MKNIRSGACCDDTAWDLAELFCVAACTNNQRYCCLLVVYVLFVYGLSSLHSAKKKNGDTMTGRKNAQCLHGSGRSMNRILKNLQFVYRLRCDIETMIR